MDIDVKTFIEDNIDLIETDKWENIYDKFSKMLTPLQDIGEFTSIMLAADIHPEYLLEHLPDGFLAESKIKRFMIPIGIKYIGHHSFYYCKNLENIIIPNTLIKVEYNAFAYCDKLAEIIFDTGIKSIEDRAFFRCNNLTNITLPGSIISLKDQSFATHSNTLTINYDSTKEQWKKIFNKHAFKTSYLKIICTDGEIIYKYK